MQADMSFVSPFPVTRLGLPIDPSRISLLRRGGDKIVECTRTRNNRLPGENTYSLQPHPSVLSGAYSCFPLPLIPNDTLRSTTYLHVASY